VKGVIQMNVYELKRYEREKAETKDLIVNDPEINSNVEKILELISDGRISVKPPNPRSIIFH
jgi:hypothetical protein